jgi:serine/threonine protein kinase
MTTPRLLSDRYELGDTLGYGSTSEVRRGIDRRLENRDVAVKVLRADLARDPQSQLRFRREAQNAAALNHPAIVAVYDTGEVQSDVGPAPYIVMEYIDGQTLRQIVDAHGLIPQQRVVEVMADVCAALDFSHKHGIIHRDVKPADIMINRAGEVKLIDFGTARALGEGQDVTQTAAVIGTAQYLSPEQARGEAVDARSDVYAAGCVLFELLTGEPPFTGDTPVAVAYQHVREDPRLASELNPQVTPQLDAIVLKALSKKPADRYQSAAAMRADLVRVRSGMRPVAPVVTGQADWATVPGAPPTGRPRPESSLHAPSGWRQQPELRRDTPRPAAPRRPLLERWFGDVRWSPKPQPAAGGVFLSYRRQSDAHFAGRLYDRLSDTAEVFMDVDSIDLGVDFVQKIEEHLAGCSVVLVVIGQNWVSVTDPRGRRRLDDPNDFVRLEVEAALRSRARVIPVLVEGATMPDPAELPPSMAPLVRRNGLVVTHARFNADVARLVEALRRILRG